MPKKQKEAVEETEVVESKGAAVLVTWANGSRVYSKEIHGADFKKLAQEFADKVGGKVA